MNDTNSVRRIAGRPTGNYMFIEEGPVLSARQRKAIKLMFHMTDEEVAAKVGVRPETVAVWLSNEEFHQALAAEARAIRSTAARMTSEASLAAAKRLRQMLEKTDPKDGKLILDTLKASGAFDAVEEDAGESLTAMVNRMADEDGRES